MQRSAHVALTALLPILACEALADPCQVDRLVAPGPFAPTSFGNSIAHSGDYWFIADYRSQILCSGFGCGAGAVYVYEMIEGELFYLQTLTSPAPMTPDNFGRSIDAEDGVLVVGSPFSAAPGLSGRPGAVFVYRLEEGLWQQASIIAPPVGGDAFGSVVSLDGDSLAVADVGNDRILVYRFDGTSWELTDELLPPPEVSARSGFGWVMMAGEGRIAVGAQQDRSVIGAGGSFHVYREVSPGQYEIEHSEYSQVQQVLGSAIAIDGDEMYVGAIAATRDFEQQGVVYRYRFEAGSWVEHGEIVGQPAGQGWGFGGNLVVAEDVLAIESQLDRAVCLYRPDAEGVWQQFARLRPETSTYADRFGSALALDGNTLLVGAHNESDTFGGDLYGATYQFDLACNPCLADLDADGSLTIFDFLAFMNLFDAGDAIADFDGDGELTIFDFLAFQTAFDAGCE